MLKKLINISCRKATFLSGKKEAGVISFGDLVKLKLHHAVCDGCKRFEQQTSFFGKNAKGHQHFSDALSTEKKQQMKQLIKDAQA
ncbi:hypothetical protein [Ferruginibacter sp. HRS2-29]|uniref:hypothetical protein n=1 Tax=Ferruginibacter sp. HRS2-29 TaxID=2487334 RepID=UPI0020CE2FEC|nr:hypothetical protein [Ferruginibacter sp. HRS2-29]MCP9753535.1 hypothetical protein [Ferruginibacter sp. HRS2-29]